ncbi:cytochrome c oxidase subunit 4 [Kutzneria kofuensis]|uniref:Cytochrome c oxidase polypeptide 4 n=1 Tax=Kutzneria kofuensis TaxID=103725 RepID=A0A7W9KDI8_9PSEU|nr:cytochrome c oxidase subunit 4 [Kutzneria kofuensis]MBB5890470.1 putative membrane channel-forming protein YqfA (hemolysin III family) [Kutzneria kofuensis]
MKIESRIFEVVAGFCFIMAIVYGIWAKEPVGIVALTLTGGLCLITGTYFRFVARRIPERPEDDTEAEISDGAGELGFFSPGSYWPVGIAAAAAIGALSLAFFQTWMLVITVVLVLITVGGLVFEYHTKPNAE